MRVFCLKTCDTCRKALAALREAGHEPEVIDVRADGMSETDMDQIAVLFGDDCINRRSTTWRGLTEVQQMERPRELLEEHPTVMKRPVIEHKGDWYLGWSANVQANLL
ncbi:MAG: arsenate reductase [Rhodobacterales bacterium]|nr:MAG: arsenate reductase [Rhodobacterales bacterium]